MTVQQQIARDAEADRLALTTAHYRLLSDSGALDSYGKTELIDGVIYVVNAQYSRHSRVQTTLLIRLAQWAEAQANGTTATVELSVDLGTGTMPRPDITVARRLPEDGPAVARDVLLIVEVANSSIDRDVRQKPLAYARGGIAEYWIVDIERGVLTQLWDPEEGRYRQDRETALGATVSSASFEGLAIGTDGLL